MPKATAYRIIPLNVAFFCLLNESERTENLPRTRVLPLKAVPLIGRSTG
jgi:hypothetical protein